MPVHFFLWLPLGVAMLILLSFFLRGDFVIIDIGTVYGYVCKIVTYPVLPDVYRGNSNNSEEEERLESNDSFTQEEEELAQYLKEYGRTPPRTVRHRRQKERDAYW